jgi:type II secretory pathway pseudopilin PulG
MNRPKFKSNQAGITLVEAVVAFGIFSIVAVVFIHALETNFRMLRMAKERTTAESLAKTQLEVINNARYNPISPYSYDNLTISQPGYTIAISKGILINPETGAVSGTDLGVQKVTCNVTSNWRHPDDNFPPVVITIESYKR